MKTMRYFTLFLLLFTISSLEAQWVVKHINDSTVWSGFNDIVVQDSIVLAGGDLFMRSDDFGESWTQVHLPYDGKVKRIRFVNNNKVILLIQDDGDNVNRYLLQSDDRGASWQLLQSFVSKQQDIFDFQFVTDSIGFFIGNDHIYKTLDGGNSIFTLTTKSSVFPSVSVTNFFQLQFVNADTGYIAIALEKVIDHKIFFTLDGGKHWVLGPTLGLSNEPFWSNFLYSPNWNYVFVAGSDGILKAEGFKLRFSKVAGEPKTGSIYHSMSLTKSGYGYCVGGFEGIIGNDVILRSVMAKTTDFGNTWEVEMDSIGAPLYKVVFANDSVGFTVSKNFQLIMKTSKGGGSIEGDYPWEKIRRIAKTANPKESDFSSQFVYPSPVIKGNTIHFISKVDHYFLYDLSGRLLLSGQNTDRLPSGDLPAGMYLLRAMRGRQNLVQKVQIE